MRLVDATQYRLPPAGIVSILHRISGIIMFVLMPFVIWLFDTSLSSEISYDEFTSAFIAGIWIFPAWIVKLVVLALIWSLLHHFLAGVRHLWMDATHAVSLEFGRSSALVVLGLSLFLTLLFGVVLFIL
jgi:succinate dehydrogenase / fumarate reductase cytochrome b subunit